MDFSSDTSAPAHPRVIEALGDANSGTAPSYGGDALTDRVGLLLRDVFETDDLEFFLCASGTAANALALSIMCSSTGAVLCHEEAHIERDERGAPEFYTGGGKLRLLPGANGKVDEAALRRALAGIDRGFVHETPAEVLSLTNLTECGTAYGAQRITEYSGLAAKAGLTTHLDGARLANALVSTGVSPADMTWRAGVDILTLGLTKTGAIGCEIIILFGDMRSQIQPLRANAKRGGHMPPKARFLASQAVALLQDGLWLDLARKANRSAQRVADVLTNSAMASLAYPVDGNEVFAHLQEGLAERLSAASCKYYPWPGGAHRFVCSWITSDDEIQTLAELVDK